MLLVVVDAYSKWFEVKVTTSTTTNATISLLDELFAAYGAPVTVVSDNGPQFASADFTSYLKNTGVKYHKLTAPYHPATNGQAERYVQTVKKALTAMGTTKDTLQKNLNTFLLQYRKAPHIETGSPPAKLFLGRNIRTRIDLVRPQDINTRMHQKQQSTFEPSFRTFSVGQKVYCLSGNPRTDKWIVGVIEGCLGDLHYQIRSNGKMLKRHVDQIRSFQGNVNFEETDEDVPRRLDFYANTETQQPPINNEANETATSSDESISSDIVFGTPMSSPQQLTSSSSEDSPPVARRSQRQRRPPLRYSPS
ncbi:uncharacterized protein K02A2.6-like [Anopheles arabiensis]|uniref:uncharacterized protein K02A2.6-like n=1 Tax=Anopheles arabiensis TaxID=7173 RepID=UPI001AADEECF|nr:uncharacterized protein K02A2.6-like [Anopheles arabiensis]